MSQYIIETTNDKQSKALIQYLKSLDFVELKPINERKTKAIAEAKSFLNGLPNQSHNQNDLNKAIKTIRKKYEFQ